MSVCPADRNDVVAVLLQQEAEFVQAWEFICKLIQVHLYFSSAVYKMEKDGCFTSCLFL